MKTKRFVMLEKLQERLSEINPSNGFINDLTDKVFIGKNLFEIGDLEGALPQLAILEPPINDTVRNEIDTHKQHYDFRLFIQGITSDSELSGKKATENAYILLAEVRKVLAQIMLDQKNRLNPLGIEWVESLMVTPGTVRPVDELSSYEYFWLPINIRWVEDLLDPFLT